MNETPSPVLDHAAFQRVWQRVMPQDRPDCPFTVAPPSLPTVAPLQPLMRAPVTPVQPAPQKEVSACLGENSAGELPLLEELLTLTMDSYRLYRALERRRPRNGKGGLLSSLAVAKGRQLRRLSTAHFLISGQEYIPAPTPAPAAKTLALVIRERFQAEQGAAAKFLSAAQETIDPCLEELYRALAAEDQAHAAQLRAWLERM